MTQSLQIANPETTPTPPPAPRGAEWVTLAEAARRSGWGERHLRRLCVDRWEPMGLARRVPAERGGKASWEVRDDAHAKLARVKFAAQIGNDLSDLTAEQRAEVGRRFRILSEWERAVPAHLNAGRSKDEATAAFLAAFPSELGEAPSARSLYRWSVDYGAEGRRGLADRRWFNAPKSDGKFSPFLEEVRRLWLDQRERDLAPCYRAAQGKASAAGWAVPSYMTAYRFIDGLDERTKIRRRRGPKAYNDQGAGFIVRDYTTLASNEIWCADHHEMDAMVRVPGQDKPVRPWLCAWQDLRSRKIVGWVIVAHAPNTETVLMAFRAAVLGHGVPESVYMDWGRDFQSFALNGCTRKQRMSRAATEVDPAAVFPKLGVKVITCQPYHGQSKPIERFFGTMEGQFTKMVVDTYCGRSPQHRPENLPDRLERGQAPTLEEFTAAFASYLTTDYHLAPHRGSGMFGKCPDDVYAANLEAKRTADADTLDEVLLKTSRPLKVGRNGVRWGQITYDAPGIDPWFGKEVRLRVDPSDVNRARVYDADDRFLCVAHAVQALPANASQQEVRDFIAAKNRRERLRRQLAVEAPRMVEDVGQHIARQRAEAAAAARADTGSTPTPPPPSMRPVAMSMATQTAAVKRALSNVTRRAAGAEYLEALERAEASAAEELSPAPAAHPALARLYDRPEEP